jgi:hypothetical protein
MAIVGKDGIDGQAANGRNVAALDQLRVVLRNAGEGVLPLKARQQRLPKRPLAPRPLFIETGRRRPTYQGRNVASRRDAHDNYR